MCFNWAYMTMVSESRKTCNRFSPTRCSRASPTGRVKVCELDEPFEVRQTGFADFGPADVQAFQPRQVLEPRESLIRDIGVAQVQFLQELEDPEGGPSRRR